MEYTLQNVLDRFSQLMAMLQHAPDDAYVKIEIGHLRQIVDYFRDIDEFKDRLK